MILAVLGFLQIVASLSWPALAINPKQDKEVVCFVYHRFGDHRYKSTNISLTNFESHLSYLKENDFQVLTSDQALDYLQSDNPPRKTAVISIDDGYKSFFENGLPLLIKYGYPASLYINTETVGVGGDFMDWSELKEANSKGIEIGNHTDSHAYFLNMPEESRYKVFEEELERSQKLIESHLGKLPTTFAYPYGELDPKMRDLVENQGFKGAFAQNSGVLSGSTDLMRCPRFPMSEAYAELDKFIMKANMHAFSNLSESPVSFVIADGEKRPELVLEITNEEILINQINCFIQGSECIMQTEQVGEHRTKITIQPTSAIGKRRRTLYTITAKDGNGRWHWYSHLWINPKVK